jgi:hypothetical protein
MVKQIGAPSLGSVITLNLAGIVLSYKSGQAGPIP